MMLRRAEGSRPVDSEWHKERQRARMTAFSTDEFGEIDIEKYDLDTARITGRENSESYTHDRPINTEETGTNGFDVRELPTY